MLLSLLGGICTIYHSCYTRLRGWDLHDLHTFRESTALRRFRGGGGQCTQFVHGRSRMTIDPRIPTMPGRSTSGFHQPGRHC